MSSKSNTQDFIAKAKLIHGSDRYDYSQVKYKNNYSKVIIKCRIHGTWGQIPNNHLRKRGCPLCADANRNDKKRLESANNFLQCVMSVHGIEKYDFSLAVYINNHSKVKVICKLHGIFYAPPVTLYKGHGCPKCSAKRGGDVLRKSTQTFIKQAQFIHGKDRYDYSEALYKGAHKKVTVICNKHGEFYVTPTNHLREKGCRKCVTLLFSKNVQRIDRWLKDNDIFHTFEKSFPTLKSKNDGISLLRYDFCIPEHRLLVEYDGTQHFKPSSNFGGEKAFKRLKANDAHKTQWAKDNGWDLLRIPYIEEKNIEKILVKTLLDN
jgi:hypothetical protein